MGFRPFDFFDKYKKTFLAALAIGCMFLFVVGDVLMGRGGREGFVGRQIRALFGYQSDSALEEYNDLARRRHNVREFLIRLNATAIDKLMRNVPTPEEGKPPAPVSTQSLDAQTLMNESLVWDINDSLFKRFVPPQALRQLPAGINPAVAQGLVPSTETLVNYVEWRREADRLGVAFTPEQAHEELRRFTGNLLDDKALRDAVLVQETPNQTAAQKEAAQARVFADLKVLIAEELRVVLARRVVLGAPNQWQSTLHSITPIDLWKQYAKTKGSMTVASIPVEVDRFLDKVGKPTDEDLESLFNGKEKQRDGNEKFYRSQLPSADRESPGFQIPPKYKMGYLYIDLAKDKDGNVPDSRKYYENWLAVRNTLMPMERFAAVLDTYENQKERRFTTSEYHGVRPVGTDLKAIKYDRRQYYQSTPPPVRAVLSTVGLGTTPAGILVGLPGLDTLPPWDVLTPGPFHATSITGAVSLPNLTLALGAAGAYVPNQIQVSAAQQAAAEIACLIPTVFQCPGTLPYPPRATRVARTWTFDAAKKTLEDDWNADTLAKIANADLDQFKEELKRHGTEYQDAFRRWRLQRLTPEFVPPTIRPKDVVVGTVKQVDTSKGTLTLPGTTPPATTAEAKPEKPADIVYTFDKALKVQLEDGKERSVSKDLIGKVVFITPDAKETTKIAGIQRGVYRAGQPIDQYIDTFAKTRGMLFRATSEQRNREKLLEGQTPLRGPLFDLFVRLETEGQRMQHSFSPKPLPTGKELEDKFVEALVGSARQTPGSKTLFEVQHLSSSVAQQGHGDKPVASGFTKDRQQLGLFWKTSETEPETPKDLNNAEARDLVVQAWRRIEARKLAEEFANKLKQTFEKAFADNKGNLEDALKALDPEYKESNEIQLRRFQIIPGGPNSPQTMAMPAFAPEQIKQANENFMDEVHEKLTKTGSTTVVKNRTGSTFYLLVAKNFRDSSNSADEWLESFHREVVQMETLRYIDFRSGMTNFNGVSFTDQVKNDRHQPVMERYAEYLKKQSQLSEENRKRLEETVKSMAPRGGPME